MLSLSKHERALFQGPLALLPGVLAAVVGLICGVGGRVSLCAMIGAAEGTGLTAMGDHSEFLDVRQHGFARVAVCVPEVRVADPAFNASAHLKMLESVHQAGAHYALCPELGLSAYSCGDLFFQDALLRAANEALRIVASASAAWNMIISVGLPLVVDGLLFNSAVTLYRGRPLAVTPKAYPPNYREFYELRWFQPAGAARATTIRVLGQDAVSYTHLTLPTILLV